MEHKVAAFRGHNVPEAHSEKWIMKSQQKEELFNNPTKHVTGLPC
jgi:hypothetical protein